MTIGKKNKRHYGCETEDEEAKKDQAKVLYEEELKRAEEEVQNINKGHTSKVGKIWEIRKRIIVGKTACLESTAIVNPENGKVVVSKRQIQEVTLKYCTETLSNNKVGSEYEEIIEAKKKEMKTKLGELGGDFKPQMETFEALVNKFNKSGKKNYDF